MLASFKKFLAQVGQVIVPTLKKGMVNAFAGIDPQWEYEHKVRTYADPDKSRYCVEAFVRAQGSVNLPGNADVLLANAGGAIELGKRWSSSSLVVKHPEPQPEP